MKNKKVIKTLLFVTATFAFFAFNINAFAKIEKDTADVSCEVGKSVTIECDGNLNIYSGDKYITKKSKNSNEFNCVKPGKSMVTCEYKSGDKTYISIHVDKNANDSNTSTNEEENHAAIKETYRRDSDISSDLSATNVGSQSVIVVNSGTVTTQNTRLDGSACMEYKICKDKNISVSQGEQKEVKDKDGKIRYVYTGPFLKNQGNIMYKTTEACGTGKEMTAFCLEAQFYGPADEPDKCLNYKASSIHPDSLYELSLYSLYELSNGKNLSDPETYFTYMAAARILAYKDPEGYQPRDATGVSNIAGHAYPYQVANAEEIGPVGPAAIALANEALTRAQGYKNSGELIQSTFGIRANFIDTLTKGEDGSYYATMAIVVQNVQSAGQISKDQISVDGLSFESLGDPVYDSGAKTLTFVGKVSGISGSEGECNATPLKVKLTGIQDKLRASFMLEPISTAKKSNRQRFAVFGDGAVNEISYDLLINNCVPEPPSGFCPQDGELTCNRSDIEGVITINEGSQGGGETDWEKCIINKTDSQGNSYDVVSNLNYQRETGDVSTEDTTDVDNISGILSTGDEITDAGYCTISCKEKYQFLLPGRKEKILQGTFFSFHTNGVSTQHAVVGISAERECVSSSINNEKFNSRIKDLRAQQVDYLNAYLYYYQLYKAMTSKEVVSAYNHRMRNGESEALGPKEDTPEGPKVRTIDCAQGCSCGVEVDIENEDCKSLSSAEQQAACEEAGGKKYFIKEYKFTTPDDVDLNTGKVTTESSTPLTVNVKLYTLKNVQELNNKDDKLFNEHELQVQLTQSFDEIVNDPNNGLGGYEITKYNGTKKDFYKRYYGVEEDENDPQKADQKNNYYIFEKKVAQIDEYSNNKEDAFGYKYTEGGTWGGLDENGNDTCGTQPTETEASADVKYYYDKEDATINSGTWTLGYTDITKDNNKQLEKYITTVDKIKFAYEQAKAKYQALSAQISMQAAYMQECTNYLITMKNDIKFEYNPIITFSYEEKTYMDMLKPNRLTNITGSDPTDAYYQTYFCDTAPGNPGDVFHCGGASEDNKKEFKFLYKVQVDEDEKQKESANEVAEKDFKELKENINKEPSVAKIEYYNVGSVGSKATYGRYSKNGSEEIKNVNGTTTTYEKYDVFNAGGCEGCFEFYQSDKAFYTTAPDGLVTTTPKNKNTTIVENDGRVYPVSIKTKAGTYEYRISFANIGQYNETGTLGRIMGGGDGKPGTMSGDARDKQVCKYEVCSIDDKECRGDVTTCHYDITGEDIPLDDCYEQNKGRFNGDKSKLESYCRLKKCYTCINKDGKTVDARNCVLEDGTIDKECENKICPSESDQFCYNQAEDKYKNITECINNKKASLKNYSETEANTIAKEYCDRKYCQTCTYNGKKYDVTKCVKDRGNSNYVDKTCEEKICSPTAEPFSCTTPDGESIDISTCVNEKINKEFKSETRDTAKRKAIDLCTEEEKRCNKNNICKIDGKEIDISECINEDGTIDNVCKNKKCYVCITFDGKERDATKCVKNDGTIDKECEEETCPSVSKCEDITSKPICKSNDNALFGQCISELVKFTDKTNKVINCCETAKELLDKSQSDYGKQSNGNYTVPTDVLEEFNRVCPPIDRECEYFEIISEDNNSDSDTILTDNNTDLIGSELQFNASTVSLNNLFPNGNSSINWKTPEAKEIITKIQDTGDGIFVNSNPDYKIVFNGECVREIKKYNSKQESDIGDGGYNDYGLLIENSKISASSDNVSNRVGTKAIWAIDNEFKQLLIKHCKLSGDKVENGVDQIEDSSEVNS